MARDDSRHERDSVDTILEEWALECPDLDVRPVGIVTRLARLRSHLDSELIAVFQRYDLTPADFQVIVTLRRKGAPHQLPQARLMSQLGLTSGTVSVRIDRLVRNGLVRREPDSHDARVTLVGLTDAGLELFDEIAPVHLGNEDRLLSALDDGERELLAGLLRTLLFSLEHAVVPDRPLGMALEPAHRARARRAAVGLSDTCGLLVTEVVPGTVADSAGVLAGDLVTAVDRAPVRREAQLHAALDAATASLGLTVLRGEQRVTLTAHLR